MSEFPLVPKLQVLKQVTKLLADKVKKLSFASTILHQISVIKIQIHTKSIQEF